MKPYSFARAKTVSFWWHYSSDRKVTIVTLLSLYSLTIGLYILAAVSAVTYVFGDRTKYY